MLGRFSTVLQNAVDALAPPAPLHEDFAYHWKKLMKHYLDVSTKKQLPIELTNIPAHFDQLLKILLKEDEENVSGGQTGPCLEYLLQHSLLDLLVTLANSDDPPGMRHHVFTFVSRFLTQLKAPIAGHTSVFPSLQRLVGLCDGSTPTPTEGVEVQFLLGLTALLRRNPQLLSVFTTSQNEVSSSKSELRRNSCSSSDTSSQYSVMTSTSDVQNPPVNNPLFTVPMATSVRSKSVRLLPVSDDSCSSDELKSLHNLLQATSPEQGLPLLDALLTYIDTADFRIRVKVCHALMLLVSLPEDKMAATLSEETMLCARLSGRLTHLCMQVPDTTELNHIDDMHVTWGLDAPTSVCLTCEGCRQVAAFLSWYDFCDQVITEAHPIIGESLGRAIAENFLHEVFTLDSLNRILSITLLTKCFRTASSHILTNVLCDWLIGGSLDKEEEDVKQGSVKQTLLDNWMSDNSQLALETLRLFEIVLEKGNDHVMESLVYVYLKNRPYILNCREDPSLDSTEDCNMDSVKTDLQVQTVINSFLAVVPTELRSTAEPHMGYEQYVSESERQYTGVLHAWNASRTYLICEPPSESEQGIFYEGPFLRTLFDSIRNIPNQEYEINLELTAVVSRLALSPHPELHEFLLDSYVLPLRPEVHTLHACLSYVATLLADALTQRPDYKRILADTRARLLGADIPHQKDDEWRSAYESVVVVEELCKELAAIAYVKHKHKS